MSVLVSIAARDAGLDAIVSSFGTGVILKLWSGSVPDDLSDPDTGSTLVTYPLNVAWGTYPASGGVKNLANVPITGATAGIGGTATYFRLYSSAGAAVMQGTITAPGGGGDMTLDDPLITSGQAVNVLVWTITDGNSS